MTLMRQLQEVMRTENGLLREMRLARLQELQAEKAALAESYELELRRLRQAPELLAGLERRAARSCSRPPCASSRRPSRANADRLLQSRARGRGASSR